MYTKQEFAIFPSRGGYQQGQREWKRGGTTSPLSYIVHQAIFQTENLMVTNKSANRKCFSWRTRAVIMTRSVESFNRETFLFSLITRRKKKKIDERKKREVSQ